MLQVRDAVSGGRAIVDALIANGVDTVFGLPGAQTYPFFDALALSTDRIRTYGARHEQASGYMAFGYARSTGRPGVFSVVPGPGVLNAGAALITALGCCAPVLLITGNVPSTFEGRGRGHLHEIPDQLGLLRRMTKWSARIERVEDAPALVNQAFREMLTGRPGPVALEMAWDTMAATAVAEPLAAATLPPPTEPEAAAIEAAARLLVAARRPMIMTGSGAQHAADEVRALAALLDAPVTALRGGRGIVSESEPLGLSSAVAHHLYPDTDVVLGIGTRLELPTMRWAGMMAYHDHLPGGRKLVRIDIDPEEMVRLKADAPIVADARGGARALIDAIRRLAADGPKRDGNAIRDEIRAAKAAVEAEIAKVQPEVDYLRAIRAALPDDGFFLTELCQAGFASYFAWDARQPRTYVSEGYQGTLGYGFPTALGVKVANPNRKVVAVCGDGGFMFGVQELATAVQEGIGVVVVVFDNGAYGNVRRDQRTRFEGRFIASELRNPDFLKLASAFGIEAHSVRSPTELSSVLPAALAAEQTVIVHVAVPPDSEASPWPFIHPAP
ncbi:Acetolactate synthase isozyme 2 large subunit [Pleomorphomonas sp. T1.2MG-36]|uniref:thiamine pyrophosphate-dependent enzyme n=1 Tax=Pleomorphomonas sp. T1.2MG-36 TaxID=3041167 RepID=UPI00247781F1|nr:thiamine pyrophosphate-dependent enzyme [Pleomorphomonas sp. T1.2MG-36]CAI9398880.1 Acetolactate synthase isozyme 2 large subunit [Pleomorphomonas sp. T1.2MG-36]